MKKFFKTTLLIAFSAVFAMSFNSCKKSKSDPEPATDTNAVKTTIINQFLDHTVAPTYTKLALYSDELVNDLKTLKGDMTQANVNKAAASFLKTRTRVRYWAARGLAALLSLSQRPSNPKIQTEP